MIADAEIDLPDVLAEVRAAFDAYEAALMANDADALDGFFWPDARAIRHGPGESLYGREEILAFRRARPAAGLERTLRRTVVTSFGRDLATASTEFVRAGEPRVGRQSQTWARLSVGWRIVAAHVSLKAS